jgi:MFS family permease
MTEDRAHKMLFWGCFVALVATSFGFITRMFLMDEFKVLFNLDDTQLGRLQGAGLWPFGVSIVLFSLVIDKIGYKRAMWFSMLCYAAYALLAWMAYSQVSAKGLEGEALAAARHGGYAKLFWGSILLGLANGTVEAYINPVVATVFRKEKVKWLNILHAGWPAGLVIAGILVISMGQMEWIYKILLILVPAAVALVMLAPAKFPVSERVASGTSYREMLGELGVAGAIVAFVLIAFELGNTFDWSVGTRWIVGLAPVALYAAYARTIGRPLMLFLILIMIPLSITELGVDSWIASLMTPAMKEIGLQGGWVLVYTSAIMMVLRFSAGPLVHRFNPVGLLAICAAIAAVGLLALSGAKGALLILGAATIYGIGKSFFWPTMLGVVSEQCPKGGALTLNALGGIGMLSVGIIGAPLIGMFQNKDQVALLEKQAPELVETVTEPAKWMGVEYTGVSPDKVAELKTRDEKAFAQVSEIEQASKQHALRKVAMFPAFMFVCYLILLLYFRSKGSYKPVEL